MKNSIETADFIAVYSKEEVIADHASVVEGMYLDEEFQPVKHPDQALFVVTSKTDIKTLDNVHYVFGIVLTFVNDAPDVDRVVGEQLFLLSAGDAWHSQDFAKQSLLDLCWPNKEYAAN